MTLEQIRNLHDRTIITEHDYSSRKLNNGQDGEIGDVLSICGINRDAYVICPFLVTIPAPDDHPTEVWLTGCALVQTCSDQLQIGSALEVSRRSIDG